MKGYKNVCFCFRTEQGKEIQIHEKAHFAEGINQPIISFGKMMQAGLKELEDRAKAQSGWARSGDRWVGVHLEKKRQTPQYHGEIDATVGWFRTTLIKQQGKWQLVELCEALHGLAEQEELIEEAKRERTF